ncbi:PucR family transcriptional regulator [Actinomadura rugatobispora]|uniref:PucR family transcriptional regulator n=1 Tax=Actinomadura rugatobispora TaxID=1994 RepID=A0ABW0ZX28_9ACTN|nr:PucR family transcriptional regulator [Actinomadura rugatobispora]
MPPTLRQVAALPQLRLRPLTGPAPDAPVRWVAVSELEDPTPFLEGGELLLTTGMRLTAEGAAPYVARLVARGVAGLGFAVGVIHEDVPPELVAASRAQGLALLEVPRPTPFIAVGKAVSRLLAAEWYEDATRSSHAQRELTRAALKGPGPLITRLARELGGWALLLDPAGEVRHAEPARARRRAPGLAPELARLRGTPDSREGASSVALSGEDGQVVVQSIGLGGRPRGFLAVGTGDPLPPAAHTIVGAAVSLLTLQSESPRTGRPLRAALAGLLLGVRPAGAAESALPDPPVRVLACAGGGAVLDALDADPAGERCLAVPLRDGPCAVIVPDRLAGQVAALARPSGPVGVSDPAEDLDALDRALAQAERALAAARRVRAGADSPHGVLHHADLPGRGLLGLLDPGVAQGFAEALLAPLRAEDPSLVASLRAYLAANGQGEAAARALGVHRHTLRTRMRKAAELLGRDLDDPAVRAELWIALAVTASDGGPIGHAGGSRGGGPEIA